ncbi:hypothetical protein Ciccas_012423 [Cichlidogyrus casuarinus]|uniref:Uncharacterized protein n=1 Tax=Cichlidogyrus casuarinus TaxID=1844966 RepID=A0ABD2PNE9_9PLAT
MVNCFETSLTQYVNNAVSLPSDKRQQITNFIRTEVGNLKTTVATIRPSLSTQPDSFFQNLISVSPTSLAAYLDNAYNVRHTANSFQNGLCPTEVNTFQTLLNDYNLYPPTTTTTTTTTTTLKPNSSGRTSFNCILFTILPAIFLFC